MQDTGDIYQGEDGGQREGRSTIMFLSPQLSLQNRVVLSPDLI